MFAMDITQKHKGLNESLLIAYEKQDLLVRCCCIRHVYGCFFDNDLLLRLSNQPSRNIKTARPGLKRRLGTQKKKIFSTSSQRPAVWHSSEGILRCSPANSQLVDRPLKTSVSPEPSGVPPTQQS